MNPKLEISARLTTEMSVCLSEEEARLLYELFRFGVRDIKLALANLSSDFTTEPFATSLALLAEKFRHPTVSEALDAVVKARSALQTVAKKKA